MSDTSGRSTVAARPSASSTHQREAVAQGHLLALEHEPLDGREHDRKRAIAVGSRLELGERRREPAGLER